jgi:hypothetical protein
MAVVINDFEVLPAAAPAPRPEAGKAGEAPAARDGIEPCAVASALRALDEQALRTWAH